VEVRHLGHLAGDFVVEQVLAAVRDGTNEILLDDVTKSSRAALAGDIGSVRLKACRGFANPRPAPSPITSNNTLTLAE
jgi:hypothetical protein